MLTIIFLGVTIYKNTFGDEFFMQNLFKPNSAIDETAATTKKRRLFTVALVFILVYMIGSTVASIISTLPVYYEISTHPKMVELLSDDELMSDPTAYYDQYTETMNEVIEEIFANMPAWMTIVSLFSTAAIIAAVLVYCCRMEKRRLFTLGFVKKGAVIEYLAGAGIGILMFAAVYGIMILSGEAKFVGFNTQLPIDTLILFLLGFVIQGASEEILLRGYFFVSSAAHSGVIPAVLTSSALFAMLHIGNAGFTSLSFINLFLFGVFAALYFLRRGSIWGICALHTTWNFAQGNIFGCTVSGMKINESIIITDSAKNFIWSGGDFGPEGGIAATLIFIIGIAVLTLMKNKHIDGFFARRGEFVSDYLFD